MDAAADTKGPESRPVRRAEIGQGVNAGVEALRLAKNRAADVSVLANGHAFTVQEALSRLLAASLRQEELLSRIAVALESAPQNGKPRGA